MKLSEFLRECGDYIQKHGFSPAFEEAGSKCGCFWHATKEVAHAQLGVSTTTKDAADRAMIKLIGMDSFMEGELINAGWTKGKTKDASAAFYIAADIAAANRR